MSFIHDKDITELTVAIVDDHQVVGEGLCSFLKKNGVHEVRYFSSGHDVLSAIATERFDIYILDVELPDIEAETLIDNIRSVDADAKLMINTMHEEVWISKVLQQKKVEAIVYKSANLNQILKAIDCLLHGQTFYPTSIKSSDETRSTTMEHPSRRERDILREIAYGLSTKEIAAKLFISENTVETHRQSLFAKLDAHNMADLMVKAIARGYINPQEIDRH